MVFAFDGSVISTGASSTSKKRSTAVLASRVIESKKPTDSVGQRRTVVVAKNATKPPTVSWSVETNHTPMSSDRPTANSGIKIR